MFKFLKEKIKKWTKKVSESKEKEVEDLEILPEVKEQIEKKVKEKKKRTEKEKESAKESKTPKKQGFFKQTWSGV